MVGSTHLKLRGGIYQYYRRVPEDVRDSFQGEFIQRSLKTRVVADAKLAAARLDQDFDEQFDQARSKKGVALRTIPTGGWTWREWKLVVAWLKAKWLRDDERLRLSTVTGKHFSQAESRLPWLEDRQLRQMIDLRKKLVTMTPSEYGRERSAHINRTLSAIRIAAPVADTYRDDFMTACLQAEIETLQFIFDREGGKASGYQHPDEIDGPWRRIAIPAESGQAPELEDRSAQPDRNKQAGSRTTYTFAECVDQWILDRVRARKNVGDHLVSDMRNTLEIFAQHQKLSTIDQVQRRHVIAFRNFLSDQKSLAVATINKKAGFITTMSTVALQNGWIEEKVQGDIYIEVPKGDSERHPYTEKELAKLFAGSVFRTGHRSALVKAGMELQFWIPLLHCCHGMSSSEIIQIGPDDVMRHPDADIWCLQITNAGGKTIKALARKRYMPIREELIELGFLKLAENARLRGWKTLWEVMQIEGRTVEKTSTYFSEHWQNYVRKELGAVPEKTALYSMRHTFKDRLDESMAPAEHKKALMGHSDSGTTGDYGTKKGPRPVDIVVLKKLIDDLRWPFLASVSR